MKNGSPSSRGRGQPTRYRPEYAEEMRQLSEAGVRDVEIAAYFGVNRMTLDRWQRAHPEFFDARAAKRARKPPDTGLYKPEFCERARKLCELGYTFAEVARLLGIGGTSFLVWRRRYPEFADAVRAGRAAALAGRP